METMIVHTGFIVYYEQVGFDKIKNILVKYKGAAQKRGF